VKFSALLAASLILPVAGFSGNNWLDVVPLGAGDAFEVVGDPGSGPSEFWCAAGRYAQQMKSVSANDRIYILRGFGPSQTAPGRSAVSFSLTAPTTPHKQGRVSVVTMKTPGYSLSLGLAAGFCMDFSEQIPQMPSFEEPYQ